MNAEEQKKKDRLMIVVCTLAVLILAGGYFTYIWAETALNDYRNSQKAESIRRIPNIKADPVAKVEESTEPAETTETTKDVYDTITAGEIGVLNNDVIMALGSEDNLDQLFEYIGAKDSVGVDMMILDGKAAIYAKGTEVKVIANNFLSVKVRVEADGKEGYVPFEYLSKSEENTD